MDRDFDEDVYLTLHPDIAAAIKAGGFISGWDHYDKFGRAEGRRILSRGDLRGGRILITGTGRAGTTLLMQIFSLLGFNTGYSREDSLSKPDQISNAGLERRLDEKAPLVVKAPWLADTLLEQLGTGKFQIRFAIIPIRELKSAADSRRRVYDLAHEKGLNPITHPGSLWLTPEAPTQEGVLAHKFYQAVYALVHHQIPIVFMKFPDFASDFAYGFSTLKAALAPYGVTEKEFVAACETAVDQKKIHFK